MSRLIESIGINLDAAIPQNVARAVVLGILLWVAGNSIYHWWKWRHRSMYDQVVNAPFPLGKLLTVLSFTLIVLGVLMMLVAIAVGVITHA